jgi:hypothetical protein
MWHAVTPICYVDDCGSWSLDFIFLLPDDAIFVIPHGGSITARRHARSVGMTKFRSGTGERILQFDGDALRDDDVGERFVRGVLK